MRIIILYFVLLFIVAFLGEGVIWILSYYPNYQFTKDKIGVAEIFKPKNVAVSENNFSCERDKSLNVGSIVDSVIKLNSLNKPNMLSFGCIQKNVRLRLAIVYLGKIQNVVVEY